MRYRMLPTCHGNGPYHPAVRIGQMSVLYYWPNITFETHNEAYECARRAVDDVYQEMFERAEDERQRRIAKRLYYNIVWA